MKSLIKISIIIISIISCNEVAVEEIKDNSSSKVVNYSEIKLESVYEIKLYFRFFPMRFGSRPEIVAS